MLRRRFGRRRGGSGERAIDASVLARLTEAQLVPVASLEAASHDDVPAGFALLARGETADGTAVVVGYSPRDAGDALLATLALASEGEFSGQAYAVAPDWSPGARRLLASVGDVSFKLEAVSSAGLEEGGRASVAPLREAAAGWIPAQSIAARLESAEARALFSRAADGLEGLAAKHGGVVRGSPEGLELVLAAKRMATLRAQSDGVALDAVDARTRTLSGDGLAEALDQLEGSLRKQLRDSRVTKGEAGMRMRAADALVDAGMRAALRWPISGSGEEVIDLVAVAEDGRPVVAAAREAISLRSLGQILSSALAAQSALPALLRDAAPPVTGGMRLVLVGERFDAAVARVLDVLSIEAESFELRGTRGRRPELASLGSSAAAPSQAGEEREGRRRAPRRRGGRGRGRDRDRDRGAAQESGDGEAKQSGGEDNGGRSRGRYAQLSAFDLDDDFGLSGNGGQAQENDSGSSGGGRGRGNRGGRRRRRRGGGRGRGDGNGDAGGDEDEGGEPARVRDRLDESDLEAAAAAADEETAELEDFEVEIEQMHAERERRRMARLAKAGPDTESETEEASEPEAEEPEAVVHQRPRKAAILAHADRLSVGAAMLLAREARHVEGIWVYPQDELMTFFRSVTTDLREDVSIYVVGFQPAVPARDTIQAASLYTGRIFWFDHHGWPPEDVEQLRQAIGREAVDINPDLGSPLPLVMPYCSRRSRFSDKLLDLLTARFTEHDYRRWGGLWWHKLGEIATQTGDRRQDLQPLLTGRPSELAEQAGKADAPPLPPELEFVSNRDFRLVHFGGHSLVLLELDPGLDPLLASRIARERYGAALSMAWKSGQELVMLAGDESGSRSFDLARMADHLAAKLEWVEAGTRADHVSRVHVRGLGSQPERIEDVVNEIAMGRTILEG